MSSMAQQLAPLATKPIPNPNAWRALVTPLELAKYDAGDYDKINPETGAKDLRKAPREPERISRDNRLVPFLESDSDDVSETWAPVYPSPEQHLRADRYARALEEIIAAPQPCLMCGLDFSDDEAKMTILASGGGEFPRGFVYCRACWNALNVPLDQDPWLTSLPKRDQRVWALRKQNLTEQEVAAKLSVGGQRVTQQMVSEIKLRLERQINERRKLNAAKRREMKYGQWVQ